MKLFSANLRLTRYVDWEPFDELFQFNTIIEAENEEMAWHGFFAVIVRKVQKEGVNATVLRTLDRMASFKEAGLLRFFEYRPAQPSKVVTVNSDGTVAGIE